MCSLAKISGCLVSFRVESKQNTRPLLASHRSSSDIPIATFHIICQRSWRDIFSSSIGTSRSGHVQLEDPKNLRGPRPGETASPASLRHHARPATVGFQERQYEIGSG